MVRTQVQLDERQMQALRARAAREKVSVAELVRQAVDRMLQAEGLPAPRERRRRAMEVAGRFSSGREDGSRAHDRYLSEAYRA